MEDTNLKPYQNVKEVKEHLLSDVKDLLESVFPNKVDEVCIKLKKDAESKHVLDILVNKVQKPKEVKTLDVERGKSQNSVPNSNEGIVFLNVEPNTLDKSFLNVHCAAELEKESGGLVAALARRDYYKVSFVGEAKTLDPSYVEALLLLGVQVVMSENK